MKSGMIAVLVGVVGMIAAYVFLSGPFIGNNDMKVLAHYYGSNKAKIKSLIQRTAPQCLKAAVDISWPQEFIKMAAETTDDVVAAMSIAGDNATREQIDNAQFDIAADRSYVKQDEFKEFEAGMNALKPDFQKLQNRYLSVEPRVMACIAKEVASHYVAVPKV